MAAPPRNVPFIEPIVLWLLGFFILMAFDARGKLSWVMGALSVAYIFLLPAYLLGALFYNLCIRTKNYRDWEERFLCLACGLVTRL